MREFTVFANAEGKLRRAEHAIERCVRRILRQPLVCFPLAASDFAEEHRLPMYLVVQAFHRLEHREGGFLLTYDHEADDLVLGFR